jgi:DNA-binding HxlR family transcriptional regulator
MAARSSRKRIAAWQRSPCPIASALDLIGDRWTLLVVRDLLLWGKRLYGEFAASPEGIPSNILADRLKRLQEAGLLEKTPYQDNPPRSAYRLTPKGRELKPVLAALAGWGTRHVAGTREMAVAPRARRSST